MQECIHAHLFVKRTNPTVGMNIEGIINTMYPTYTQQHDFMYNKMIPTIEKVLGEIRDLEAVTTEARKADVADLKIYLKRDLSAFETSNLN